MQLNYKLESEDFLEHQLYIYSQSKSLKSTIKKTILLTILVFIPIIAITIKDGNYILSAIIGTIVITYLLFAKKLFKARIKKSFYNYVFEYYDNQFGKENIIEIDERTIKLQTKSGYSVTYLSEVKSITETPNLFMIDYINKIQILIPKSNLESIKNVRKDFQVLAHRLSVDYNDELNWKWN